MNHTKFRAIILNFVNAILLLSLIYGILMKYIPNPRATLLGFGPRSFELLIIVVIMSPISLIYFLSKCIPAIKKRYPSQFSNLIIVVVGALLIINLLIYVVKGR